MIRLDALRHDDSRLADGARAHRNDAKLVPGLADEFY